MAWGLVQKDEHGVRKPLVALERHGKVRGGARTSDGGRAKQSIAGEQGSGGARATNHQKLTPKDRTDWAWLTEGAGWKDSQCRGSTTAAGGGAEAVLADGVQRRSSWRLDPSRWCANKLLTRIGDQRGPRVKGGEQLPETDSPATMGMGTITAMA